MVIRPRDAMVSWQTLGATLSLVIVMVFVACSADKKTSASKTREDEIDSFAHVACGEWEKIGERADAGTLTAAMWQEGLSTAAPAAERAAALDEELREFASAMMALKTAVLPEDFVAQMGEDRNLATYVAQNFLEGNARPFVTVNTTCRRFAHD